MAEIFKGGNTNSIAQEYAERKKYVSFIRESGFELLDTLYEKKLYGFINKDFEVVSPIDNTVLFGAYAGEIEGITFTVDMFNLFRKYYLEKVATTGLRVPALVAGLSPGKSHVGFLGNYNKYIQNSYSILLPEVEVLMRNNFLSFEEFIEIVNSAIFAPTMNNYAITKTGYLLSKDSSVHETGLYTSLAPSLSLSEESAKALMIQDPGFKCYIDFAKTFGFFVDAHAPWRLIVNLDSPIAQGNILNGRPPESFYDFYSDVYTKKVGFDDLAAVKSFYQNLYIDYAEQKGIIVLQRALTSVPVSRWLECLLINKFRELGLMREPSRSPLFLQTYQKVLDYLQQPGISSQVSGPVGYINRFCAEQLKLILNEGEV